MCAVGGEFAGSAADISDEMSCCWSELLVADLIAAADGGEGCVDVGGVDDEVIAAAYARAA